jgi:hypothetical protein
MLEQSSAISSEEPNAESVATGSSSANGANPEDTVGVPDGSAEELVTAHGEPADESPTASLPAVEASVSEAADERSLFLADLVRAMQTTAGLERVRIGEDTERRRQALIDQVRAREASEAERIRELAGEDMKAIEAWVDGEERRIRLERERRATDLNDDLDLSLSEHRSKIDLEIERVETAIANYRADVDAFFERLDRETDLVRIVQQAARRPVFPTLDTVAATIAPDVADAPGAEPSIAEPPPAGTDDGTTGAGTVGAPEPTMVGVMDPEAAAEPVELWAVPPETSPEPVPAGAFDDVDQGSADRERAEPVTAAIGASDGNSGTLFKSMAVKQPMGWLRRHANGGDDANGEG